MEMSAEETLTLACMRGDQMKNVVCLVAEIKIENVVLVGVNSFGISGSLNKIRLIVKVKNQLTVQRKLDMIPVTSVCKRV